MTIATQAEVELANAHVSALQTRVAHLEMRTAGVGTHFGGLVPGRSSVDRQEQELRLKCLGLAKDAAIGEPDRVVKLAEQFHTFVTAKDPSCPA